MSETAFATFSNGISVYLTTSIFPSLIRGLAEKGVCVTADELLEMTKIPPPKSSISIPPIGFGGSSVHPMTMPRGAKQQSVGPTCLHVLQRGVSAGNVCGKKTIAGSSYCGSHNPNKVVKAPTVPGIAPTVTPTQLNVAAQPQLNVAVQPQLNATVYDGDRGLYHELNHGFILRKDGQDIVVVGGYSDEGIVPLTAQQRQIADSLGVEIECCEVVEQEEVPTISSLQISSQEPAAPTIPFLKPVTTQSSSGIPTIPSLKMMGIPSTRSIPPLSQIS